MKKFAKKTLSFLLACSLLFSLSVPASADFDATYMDSASVTMWEARVTNPLMVSLDILAESFGVAVELEKVFWAMVNEAVQDNVGEVSVSKLHEFCDSYNEWFNQPMGKTFFGEFINKTDEIAAYSFSRIFLGEGNLKFEVRKHPTTGLWRIYETTTELWLVSSAGTYAYAQSSVVDQSGGNKWIGDATASDQVAAGRVVPEPLDRLNAVCATLKEAGKAVELRALGSHYKAIWCGREVYADAAGYPFVAPVVESGLAVNQTRPDATVKDENGNVVEGLPEGNITNIDLSGMTITLPDGSMNLIDNLYYDESTKTYHIDSHDTYNTSISYHYEWNYYINYTSITYIGTTEEYNKYYEVYYELPDGRDSADLTREELEQLSVGVDVIPYGRSADDTSLRSLYHFDGDTKDASYWNYCTSFTWNTGASLTYMDAAVFEGALYLDENEHDFTLKLPSEIGSDDFTLQFRYYQSYTAAPQTDSYIQIGLYKILQMDGGYLKDSEGTQLAGIPVGTWNEIAVIRDSGILYFYLNGVCVGSFADPSYMNNQVDFHFGSAQQTYKYLDELRVLDYAMVSAGESYMPTSVPHDSNMALVLPDTVLPVADEYWEIKFSDAAQLNVNFTNNGTSDLFVGNSSSSTFLQTGKDGIAMMFDDVTSTNKSEYNSFPDSSNVGGVRVLKFGLDISSLLPNNDDYDNKYYPISVSAVMGDESHYTLNLSVYRSGNPKHYNEAGTLIGTSSSPFVAITNGYLTAECNSYDEVFFVMNPSISGTVIRAISVWVGDPVSSLSAVTWEDTSIDCEKVTSVTPMTPDQMNTPTLAVRTDLDITNYQIGGVRPSVPEKGMVWALVENERIASIQVYNGQAWEGVDGRIWTGERWIPASSYNVITLQDMYDIADATPDYEYIYTEPGFWDWWQKSWNDFTKQLFLLLATDGGAEGA